MWRLTVILTVTLSLASATVTAWAVGPWTELGQVESAATLVPVTPTTAPPVTTVTPVPSAGPLKDVAYGPGASQRLDLYRPSGMGAGPVPVIVWVHGGAWQLGDKSVIPEVVRRQIERAQVAVASLNYRLVSSTAPSWVPPAPIPAGTAVNAWPAPMNDVDRALRWLHLHAAEYGLDPERMVVWGASAGAQLATMAAVAPGVFADPALPLQMVHVDPHVAGYVAYGGRSDFLATYQQAPAQAGALRNLLDCATVACDPLALTVASSMTYLDADDPPGYLVCGRVDPVVSCPDQSTLFARRAATLRAEAHPSRPVGVELEVTAAGHALDLGVVDVSRFESMWLDPVLRGALR